MPSSNITPHAILTIRTKIDFYAKKSIPVSYAHFLRKAKCDKYLISGSLLVVKNKKNLNVKSRANEKHLYFSCWTCWLSSNLYIQFIYNLTQTNSTLSNSFIKFIERFVLYCLCIYSGAWIKQNLKLHMSRHLKKIVKE